MTCRASDRCPDCGSTSLFDGYFDDEGFAITDQGVTAATLVMSGATYRTSCNDCGWLGILPSTRKRDNALWERDARP